MATANCNYIGTQPAYTILDTWSSTPTWKDKSKFCTNCKCRNHNAAKCWEEGDGNHANAPHWIKKNAGNIGDDKKKGKEANVHATKDDSSSESAAIAYDLLKPQNMHEERVSITWDDKTPSEE